MASNKLWWNIYTQCGLFRKEHERFSATKCVVCSLQTNASSFCSDVQQHLWQFQSHQIRCWGICAESPNQTIWTKNIKAFVLSNGVFLVNNIQGIQFAVHQVPSRCKNRERMTKVLLLQKGWAKIVFSFGPFTAKTDAILVLCARPAMFPEKNQAYFKFLVKCSTKLLSTHLKCSCTNDSTIRTECHCLPLFWQQKGQIPKFCFQCGQTSQNTFVFNVNNVQGAMFTCYGITIPRATYTLSDVYAVTKWQWKKLCPCTLGTHLQDCTQFECPLHVKCPHYFCVPWKYKCDGKWDCLQGHDETSNCSVRVCHNMLQCKMSSLFIHLNDIRNGVFDCHFRNNGVQCGALYTICSDGCSCLHFAVWCENVTFQAEWILATFWEKCHKFWQQIMSISLMSISNVVSWIPSSIASLVSVFF